MTSRPERAQVAGPAGHPAALAGPAHDRLVGEPMVVPRSDREDDVWILSIVRDLSRNLSHLAVWDGEHPTDAPVARAWFDQQLHHTLHGVFLPAVEARSAVR